MHRFPHASDIAIITTISIRRISIPSEYLFLKFTELVVNIMPDLHVKFQGRSSKGDQVMIIVIAPMFAFFVIAGILVARAG